MQTQLLTGDGIDQAFEEGGKRGSRSPRQRAARDARRGSAAAIA
ncbi:hypothetical protein ACJU26_04545 [Acidithiobacillus sp. M4-SHS-6]